MLLLYHGADPNLADFDGNTALHHCAVYNNESCLKALLNFSDTLASPRPRSDVSQPQLLRPASKSVSGQPNAAHLARVTSDSRMSQSVMLSSQRNSALDNAGTAQSALLNGGPANAARMHVSMSVSVAKDVPVGGDTGLRLDAVNEAGDNVLHICARWSYETACRLVLDRLDVVHLAMFDARNRRKLTPADCACTSTTLAQLSDMQQTLKTRQSEEMARSVAHKHKAKPKRISVFAMSRSRTIDSESASAALRSKKLSLDASMHQRAATAMYRPSDGQLSGVSAQPPNNTDSAADGAPKQQASLAPRSTPSSGPLPLSTHVPDSALQRASASSARDARAVNSGRIIEDEYVDVSAEYIDSAKPSESKAVPGAIAAQTTWSGAARDAPRQREATPDSKPDGSMKELSNKLLRAAADGDVPLVKYYLECGGAADELEVLTLLNASRSRKIDKVTFAHTSLESFMCHPLCQCEVCSSLHNVSRCHGLPAHRMRRIVTCLALP